MGERLTIGEVSRRTGLSVRAIRFYERSGLIPLALRAESGYRLFGAADVRRLRLARHTRVLGLPLLQVKELVERAFASDCLSFGEDMIQVITKQRSAIDARIEELRSLRRELDDVEAHVRHSQSEVAPGQLVGECDFCPMIDERG